MSIHVPPAYIDAYSDHDPIETAEWLHSLDAVLEGDGRRRARYILDRLLQRANAANASPDEVLTTDFVNTIPVEEQPEFPGDIDMERRIRRIIRWNAMAMVVRANMAFEGIGGHISTYASAASLYEVGFNHFFRGKDGEGTGDQIYFQGHAAPGVYARAYLEGRLDEARLGCFRRETDLGRGLSSYPHPRLMTDFWEFPTVSMGLGPMAAIYHARFNRYLQARGIVDTSRSRVWSFVGDGEMDEPESLGALWLAARERLDNLTMVVNCNLQRLDGPVRGNSKIIQELEGVFRGAGWNVIKVVWGGGWDDLLARDRLGLLRRRMNEVVDGQFQKYATAPGDYTRRDFFGAHPKLEELVSHLTDEDIVKLRRGGHDYRKIYAAYRWATEHKGQPTCILAHTVKGWTLGEGFEARNVTHQMKKMTLEEMKHFRDVLELPIPDTKLIEGPAFFHPGADSDEVQYLLARRKVLDGFVPTRRTRVTVDIDLPKPTVFEEFHRGTKEGVAASTTAAYARLLIKLIRDPSLGARIVPIIPDEARTFGMDAYFREVGIYAHRGQLYEPVDKGMLLYYREATDGQVLEEGITEAGAMSSFTAAGTCHTNHGKIMIPFYTFYSMFGFQRTADQIWAFGDSRGRGFLMGATAGRTTLNGEGLQHADGHSQLLATTVPNIVAYDPAWAFEVAVVIEDGLRRMVKENEDVFYYVTLHNEGYEMPAMPEGAREGVLRGLYRFRKAAKKKKRHVQLFGSGSILREVLRAADLLAEQFGVSADVWSATSYQQLRADALAAERWNRLHPEADLRKPYITEMLEGTAGPVVAATDYMKSVADQVARWVPGRFVPLGTDGYGMSDTREALRRHFEVDAESIVIAALDALRQDGAVSGAEVAKAIKAFDYDPDKIDPITV